MIRIAFDRRAAKTRGRTTVFDDHVADAGTRCLVRSSVAPIEGRFRIVTKALLLVALGCLT